MSYSPKTFSFHSLRLWIIGLLIFLGTTCLTGSQASLSSMTSSTSESTDLAEEVTETATLTSPALKTWQWNTTYGTDRWNCKDPSSIEKFPRNEIPSGQIEVGYVHYADNGGLVLPCVERKTAVFEGTIMFGLAEIGKKAPVYVTSAKLNFKIIERVVKNGKGEIYPDVCDDMLMIARTEPMGYAGDLVPGADPLPLGCGSGGCSVDVRSVVNNWLKGSEDPYGWVIKGEDEEPAGKTRWNNSACLTRYGDFSLTVTYKYNKKPPVIYVPPPTDTPAILVAPGVIGGGRTNVALVSNGGAASSSSDFNEGVYHFTAAGANNGDRRETKWGSGGGWNDASPPNTFPDWLQIVFAGEKTINEIDVFTAQDDMTSPVEPTDKLTFTKLGLSAFEVQYWDGSWITVPGGNITGNNLVWRKITFPSIATTKIRVLTHNSPDGYSRLTEVEAWTP